MENLQNIPVRFIKGIGPRKAKKFSQLDINTVEDLLYYFPKRYEDRTHLSLASDLKAGEVFTIKVKILSCKERRSFKRRGFIITEALVGDNSGAILSVWFNQPYLKDYFKTGQELILNGRVERYGDRLQMNSPEFEIVGEDTDDSLSFGRLIPVYSLPEGITQRAFRRLIKNALDDYLPKINECLPYNIRSRNNFLNLAKSLINIHFPEDLDMQKQAYTRLSFEEFFLFQIPIVLRKLKSKQKPGIAHRVDAELVDKFINSLPFKLTPAQIKVLDEIKQDMSRPIAMQRLLQGDVGSGKTVVATLASLIAVCGGYQVAFMVPTEILAKQHYSVISRQLSKVGNKIKVALLAGSVNPKEKEKISKLIKKGKVDLVIGTHALLEEDVNFYNLGLVVIDEQHKFGVGQRALLPKKGINPDVLIMTATPIPRTLAITLYGDLDISIITELPPGRGAIKTRLFNLKEESRAYEIAKEQLKIGKQVYIIYPVIEESYTLDIAGAKKMYAEFKKQEFKGFKLGLIHGRLKQEEQDRIMLKFKQKELDLLVSTTVLEVGIDISNATCMIVQHAERFGLSQLHQLRGRVGRGADESFCLLISDAQTKEAEARLQAMVQHNNGFRIAEQDLKIRGPGDFFGERQHGLTELKIANPLTQFHLLKKTRKEAIELIHSDPHLELRQNFWLREKLLQRFPGYEKLVMVG